MRWFERVDARYQRRMERLQAKHDAKAERPDAGGGWSISAAATQ